MKILCVGEILVDMIADGHSLEDAGEFHSRPGGAPTNVAVASSRMGADVDMAATLGNDGFGDMLKEKLENEGVGLDHIRTVDEKTTLAFVALDDNAEPEFSFYREADTFISPDQLTDGYDIIHFGSLPFTDPDLSEMMRRYAKESEALISFDPNLRSDFDSPKYMERLRGFIREADLVFLSEEEAESFDIDAEEILVTKGSSGATLTTKEFSEKSRPPEVDPVDTTGAGDALAGAYLAFRDEGRKDALEKAVEASALSTLEKGAMSALPDKDDLAEFE
jgi:sugar/nucleoside kinase (ribokinase family)